MPPIALELPKMIFVFCSYLRAAELEEDSWLCQGHLESPERVKTIQSDSIKGSKYEATDSLTNLEQRLEIANPVLLKV